MKIKINNTTLGIYKEFYGSNLNIYFDNMILSRNVYTVFVMHDLDDVYIKMFNADGLLVSKFRLSIDNKYLICKSTESSIHFSYSK